MLPEPLKAFAAWPQFVAWRLEWVEERGDWGKIPYSPVHGRKASSTEPSDWGTYEQAKDFADRSQMAGVGFVFTANDPFYFLDVDKALKDGQWSQLAQELCARLSGAAIEVSQSGTGLHIFGMYSRPFEHAKKNIPLRIELYTQGRFVALTGNGAIGDAATLQDDQLASVVAQFFNPQASSIRGLEWTTEPDTEWKGPEDDEELIARALRSGKTSASEAFGAGGDKVSFSDLWTANIDALSSKWPGTSGPYDASSADQALANLLAFWTGRNCERIERIMFKSALKRQKWDDRPDYVETTILKAIQLVRTVYKSPAKDDAPAPPPPPPPSASVAEAANIQIRTAGGRMFFDGQMQHFSGCIYVTGPHRILTPRGELLDQGRFDAVMGGYEFIVDAEGKKTTTSAWEAFTKAQTFIPPRADRLCFRPENGPGGIVWDSGLALANTYFPAEPDVLEGDPSKFVNHIRKMLPHGDDADLLLGWMATAVQNPGRKIQWWPVVQGAEGNFKSFLLLIMASAVGSHYAHLPNMEKMVKGNSNFNGWLDRKLFLGLEEVYAANRREFFESFKTTVTNLRLPIEGKGIEEATGDNRANGIITTNHQDGVPVIGTSRRFAAFFCAQQSPEDMIRDGMNQEYVLDLKDWLLGLGAYASGGLYFGVRVMAGHLHRVEIAEKFNALNFTRAPETSSTVAAKTAGLGRVEQEILEAIGEERPGFCGGWISSLKLDELLERKRLSVPRNKRRDLLKSLGYDWHPALEGSQGRVNNPVMPDNGKPRLFCKVGSIDWNNRATAAQVAEAYTKAQAAPVGDLTAAQFGK